jgi:DNA-binding LacI/PurR family transcriptional regulator
MITINDVAKLSGVTTATVSRVLNGGKNVKKETMEKVLDAIKKLNYKPNKIARNLAKGRFTESTIGVILTVAIYPFFYNILKGIYRGLSEQNYNILIFNIGKNRKEVFEHIVKENLSGVLIVATGISEEEKMLFQIHNMKFVYLDFFEENENSIFIDNYLGGNLAANYFISKNINKIALVGEDRKTQQQENRFLGFKDVLSKNGINIKTERHISFMENMPYSVHGKESYKITKELIENTDIEGIFYYCDELAYGGLKAKKELKSSIFIIGYDDLPSSRYFKLTTIRQPAYLIGYYGARNILNVIKTSNMVPIKKCISPKLVVRKT